MFQKFNLLLPKLPTLPYVYEDMMSQSCKSKSACGPKQTEFCGARRRHQVAPQWFCPLWSWSGLLHTLWPKFPNFVQKLTTLVIWRLSKIFRSSWASNHIPYFLKYCPPLNNVPPFSQNREDIKYIKFEILQIVSPSEDVKFSNVRGLYLRKYGRYLLFKLNTVIVKSKYIPYFLK